MNNPFVMVGLLSFWAAFLILATMFHASQNPVATKSRIANPFNETRALEVWSKARATYQPIN